MILPAASTFTIDSAVPWSPCRPASREDQQPGGAALPLPWRHRSGRGARLVSAISRVTCWPLRMVIARAVTCASASSVWCVVAMASTAPGVVACRKFGDGDARRAEDDGGGEGRDEGEAHRAPGRVHRVGSGAGGARLHGLRRRMKQKERRSDASTLHS